MKTLFNSALKVSLATILISVSFLNESFANEPTLKRNLPSDDIKKVIVTGNAKVVLIQNSKEFITMEEDDIKKVSFNQVGSTLTVKSTEESPVTVTIYVKNIYRIDARDRSVVRTSGKCNFQNLQVLLRDNASANVKAETKSLYTVVSGQANLTLAGKTNEYFGEHTAYAAVDSRKLDIDQRDRSEIGLVAANTTVSPKTLQK